MSLSSIFRFSVLTPSTIFCMSWGIVQERKAVFYRSAIQTSHTNAPLPSPLISPIQTTPSLKICSLMTCSNLMRRFTSAKKSRRVERCYIDFFLNSFFAIVQLFLVIDFWEQSWLTWGQKKKQENIQINRKSCESSYCLVDLGFIVYIMR